MSSPITLNACILTSANLSASVATVSAEPTPNPPSGLTNKYRWMQCTLKNETQFPLVCAANDLESGKYWTAPIGVSSFQQMVFSVCNGDGTIWTGATGGTVFSLVLDGNNNFNVAFGWANPNSGAIKAGVIESSNPADGYNAASNVGNNIDSKNTYIAPDTAGGQSIIRFHVSAVPGQETQYVITEVILS